ncbi:hypothetical protein SUGI_0664820 [Cryptomeria japonica]|nr:hypothetical protein SUGI_0664820 [Cryptomeria japonica]
MNRLAFNCLKHFILALAMLILQYSCHLFVAAGDTLSLGGFLREKQTIISKNGTFELGFFSPNGTNNWYVDIWYAHISVKTIVWVANRETPIRDMPGVFTLSSTGYCQKRDGLPSFRVSTGETRFSFLTAVSAAFVICFPLF